jgi:hypothetical protein
MDQQPDPKKAIYLKPNQRRVPGSRRSQKPKRDRRRRGSRTRATRRSTPGGPPCALRAPGSGRSSQIVE